MTTAEEERSKAFVWSVRHVVQSRDYTAAQRFWSPDYIQQARTSSRDVMACSSL